MSEHPAGLVLPPGGTYVQVPPPVAPEPTIDPIGLVLAESLRETIWQMSATSVRSLQVTAGASEIGGICARQTAYRSTGAPAVNFPDPWRSTVGTGVHAALADYFRRADGGSGRYLVEHPITYRGVPGTVDLFDRRRHLVVDWKSPLRKRISDVLRGGPDHKYVVQAMIYAAGLREQGETVERVALAYVPADGSLSDLYVWHTLVDTDLADAAISAAADNAEVARVGGAAAVPATPSRLCPWCSHYRPEWTGDLSIACPGET